MRTSFGGTADGATALERRTQDQRRAIANGHETIKAYYAAVAEDYRAWSPKLNMHFGFWEFGVNPLNREAMLERMNRELLASLSLPSTGRVRLADLGCGAGATGRSIARARPQTQVDGVTLSMEQVLQGAALNRAEGMQDKVKFFISDFANTSLPEAGYDGAYALESACHAVGPGKHGLLSEAHRLLKPGGRLVIVDAFLRRKTRLPAPIDAIYRSWCRNWAVSELAEISAMRCELEKQGFTNVEVRDISWNLAPSALQIPLFATFFALRELWRARFRLSGWRQGHILASYAAFLMGCWRRGFGYFIVTATKQK